MKKTSEFAAVAAAMARIDFCMMQTFGAQGINTRPMSNNGEVHYDGDNWFFARADSTKIAEIQKDARVQLTFSDCEGPGFISVWGTGSVVDDVLLKRQHWHKSLERWFENGPDDPGVALVRVSAERIQTWGRLGECVLWPWPARFSPVMRSGWFATTHLPIMSAGRRAPPAIGRRWNCGEE